jgi:hypothetical protein
MPQPTLTDLHVNTYLSNMSIGFRQQELAYVASKVFPNVPVPNKSDLYPIYSRADWNRDTMRQRAPGTESVGGGWDVTNATFVANVWALHKDIDDQIRANSDPAFNLDSDATRWLTQQSMTNREVAFKNSFMTSGVWTTTRTGVASGAVAGTSFLQWNDPASDPILDIRTFKRVMQLASGGYRANTAVLGRTVIDTLLDHPDFVNRVVYGGTPGAPARVNMDAVAALLELDNVYVMDAIINSGPEAPVSLGINAAESNAFISDKAVLLLYVDKNVGPLTPTAGVTFSWTGLLGNTANGERIKSFYMDPIESTRVEIESAYVLKATAPDLGIWMPTAVA